MFCRLFVHIIFFGLSRFCFDYCFVPLSFSFNIFVWHFFSLSDSFFIYHFMVCPCLNSNTFHNPHCIFTQRFIGHSQTKLKLVLHTYNEYDIYTNTTISAYTQKWAFFPLFSVESGQKREDQPVITLYPPQKEEFEICFFCVSPTQIHKHAMGFKGSNTLTLNLFVLAKYF